MKTIAKILFVISFLLPIVNINAQEVWVKQNSGTPKLLYLPYFTSADTGTVVGQQGTILRTVNGGKDWFPQESYSPHSLTAVYFSNPDNGVAIGASGTVLKTEDGGETWINQHSGFYNFLLDMSFPTPNIGYVVGESGLIIKSTDGGKTWSDQNSEATDWLFSVHFVNEYVGTAVSFSGEIIRTINGGQSWTMQNSGTTESLVGVYFTNPDFGIVVGYNGTILRTTDGGQNWTKQFSGTSSWLRGIYFVNDQYGIIAGEKGIILKTNNGGIDWTQMSSGTNSDLVGIHMRSENEGVIVGREGVILNLQYTDEFFITADPDPIGGGSVSGPGKFSTGELVSLSALPAQNFEFLNWTENGTVVSQDISYQFYASANRALKANFYTDLPTYAINTDVYPASAGTVIGSGVYAAGQTAKLEAIENSFYEFLNWQENGVVVSTEKTFEFTVEGDRNLIANFYLTTEIYSVTASVYPSGGGKISGTGNYPGGQDVVLSAASNNGFVFTNWTENNIIVSTDSIYSFKITGNKSLTANFYALNKPTLMAYPDLAFYVGSSQGECVLIIKNLSGGILNWTATKDASWIKFLSDSTGAGEGSIKFSYEASHVYYRWATIIIEADNAFGSPRYVDVIQISYLGDDTDSYNLPRTYNLYQNYPNPFNPLTSILYEMPEAGTVSLKVYDILGREIAVLINEHQIAGYYRYDFNSEDYDLPSGIYFYRLTAGSKSIIKKMILMK